MKELCQIPTCVPELVMGVLGFLAFLVLIKGTTERVKPLENQEPEAQMNKEKVNYFKVIKSFAKNKAAIGITVASIFQLINTTDTLSCNSLAMSTNLTMKKQTFVFIGIIYTFFADLQILLQFFSIRRSVKISPGVCGHRENQYCKRGYFQTTIFYGNTEAVFSRPALLMHQVFHRSDFYYSILSIVDNPKKYFIRFLCIYLQ